MKASITAWTIVGTTVAMLTAAGEPVQGADWSQFRGPGGQGVVAGAVALPTSWSDEQNLAWKTPMPGFGASSPIVHGDRVYVTCYSGYGLDGDNPGRMDDLRLHVVCLDLANGQIHWTKTLQPILPETERVRDQGYAAATPSTDGERL
jgi:outer membrane protein assembly factor BamB